MSCRAIAVVLGVVLAAAAPADGSGQEPALAQAPVIKSVRIDGASVYSAEEIAGRHHLVVGSRLEKPVADIAADIVREYHNDGYALATVDAAFDETLREVVYCGGYDPLEQTWVFRGDRWQRVLARQGPRAADGLCLAWLPAAQRLVAQEPDVVGGTGAWLSSFTLAITEVTERAKLPWLTLSYSDVITERGSK